MTTAAEYPKIEEFDFYDLALPPVLNETLSAFRDACPVGRSNARGGYWLVTAYEDVREVLSNWQTFSSADGPVLPPKRV